MEVTIEEKLRLLQKLREDAGTNENAIQVRRSLLSDQAPSSEEYVGQGGLLSFKLRAFFSVILFGAYLLMQYGGFSAGGLTSHEIAEIISEQPEGNLFDFTAYLPYTLEE